MTKLLRRALEHLELLTKGEACDHSVGICYCDTFRVMDELREATRVELRKSSSGWRVARGNNTLQVGDRVHCKKWATEFCKQNDIPSWWHQKKGVKGNPGKWIEIVVV